MKIPAFALILFSLLWPSWPASAQQPEPGPSGTAHVLHVQGAIGPATAEFVRKGFETARNRNTALIILTLDTPGGLAASMRSIILSILDAPVPVVGFVYPSGARAASAGTYILYASHIAAMAPGTNLGAATPVRIGGGLPVPGSERKPGETEKDAPDGDDTAKDPMGAKVVNDAAAYIRSLAEMRGRNAEWAEQAVRQGVSLTVREALDRQVIDVIASDIDDLLRNIDGRQVVVGSQPTTVRTAGLTTETIEPGWRIRLLSIITNPNIAFILILIGVYGLFFEFANPGTIGPGIAGVICLILGFYALNVLPLNYAGLGLVLLAIALMAAEAFVPSFGILGIGGIIAFILGAMMMFKRDIPGFGLSWTVIAATAAVSGGLMIFVLGYVWKAQRRPITTGGDALVGQEAEVLEWSGQRGYVRLYGERWRAEADDPLSPGDRVQVIRRDGLALAVSKKNFQTKG